MLKTCLDTVIKIKLQNAVNLHWLRSGFLPFCSAVSDSRGTGSGCRCCLLYLAGNCLLTYVELLISDVRMGFLQDSELIHSVELYCLIFKSMI